MRCISLWKVGYFSVLQSDGRLGAIHLTAYYNENDKDKAEWLRELIRQNTVAPGEVDERDIKQVTAKDLQGFRQCHFFAGIGVWSYSLRLAGWPDDRSVWTGSCPCPSFSAAGQGRGFDDPRHLWPDWSRLAGECRPATIFGEQVDDAIGHGWLDLVQTDLERQAYAVGKAVLGACSVGAPHIRQRLYFVAESECDQRFDRRGIGEICNESPEGDSSAERSHIQREVERFCDAGSMADSDGGNPRAERQQRSAEYGQFAQDGGIGERLGDAAQHGSGPLYGESRPSDGQKIAARGSGISLDVGVTEREGLERHVGHGGNGNESRRQRTFQTGSTAAAGKSFWADADWIWCRDGKYRPVRPGSFPLVTGAPSRVLRLRGYGDAINAEVAKAFIQAYLES